MASTHQLPRRPSQPSHLVAPTACRWTLAAVLAAGLLAANWSSIQQAASPNTPAPRSGEGVWLLSGGDSLRIAAGAVLDPDGDSLRIAAGAVLDPDGQAVCRA